MSVRSVLLVEDNPMDEKLTVRSVQKSNLKNRIDGRDGQQALDYLIVDTVRCSLDANGRHARSVARSGIENASASWWLSATDPRPAGQWKWLPNNPSSLITTR